MFFEYRKRYCFFLAIITCIFMAAPAQPSSCELRFNRQGKFKIVQFTDIHWKNGSASCSRVLRFMARVLDSEQPDLVVLTGDIVTSKPARQGWEAVVRPMIARKIPWAVTLGNHDDPPDTDMTKAEIISLLETMRYSVVQAGPKDIGGTGSYVLPIKGAGKQAAALIYCLDSLAYVPMRGKDEGMTYAWIKSQIEWYRTNSMRFTKANKGRPLPSLVFLHVPLPEYRAAWNNNSVRPAGTKGEEVSSPLISSGFFSAMLKNKDVMGVFAGHDHDNDYVGYLYGVYLAYGRITGYDANSKLERGARVIELSEALWEFDTWLRTDDWKYYLKIQRSHCIIR